MTVIWLTLFAKKYLEEFTLSSQDKEMCLLLWFGSSLFHRLELNAYMTNISKSPPACVVIRWRVPWCRFWCSNSLTEEQELLWPRFPCKAWSFSHYLQVPCGITSANRTVCIPKSKTAHSFWGQGEVCSAYLAVPSSMYRHNLRGAFSAICPGDLP